MKRTVFLLSIIFVVFLLSGCVISKTPSSNDVTMTLNEQMTFSVKVFPSNATYSWTLDGTALANTDKSYVYTAEAGNHTLTVKAKRGSRTDTQTWNIQVNSPPVANAGADQSVYVNSTVTLDGSGSTDPDNDIVSYQWEQTGGPAVTITNADTAIAQFSADVAAGSVLTFELTVTDANGLSSMDICVLSVGYIMFNKTYGGSKHDAANAIQQTNDGGYIVAGYTQSYGAGNKDFWLIKTDAFGNKVWDKIFGGGSDDYVNAVQQTSDGGYILAGDTFSYSPCCRDIWLIKTDANGNKIWDKTFGGSYTDFTFVVQQTSDSGYIVAGYTESYGAGNEDAWLIKTDANGNKVWDKTFGGSSADGAKALQQTSDGGYVLAGITYSYGAGSEDAWLIKTDANGNNIWSKTFGGWSYDGAEAIQQTNDGGYIIAGYTQHGGGVGDAWLIKTDANGNKVWDKTFGGSSNEYASAVQQTSDDGYIVAGYTESYGAGRYDFWLIKTDAFGNKVWDKIFGGSFDDYVNAVQQTSDGGYIFAGLTLSYGAGNYDVWLIKTDADGNAPVIPIP